jgi:DNA/RNA-binding domain of Phe-tRNA-synthetase-like protein
MARATPITTGSVAAPLRGEFAGLALRYLTVDRGSGRSPRDVKERLRELSNRFTGGEAVNLRHRPIPWAYRVFFRHIGLDPDRTRTPVEQAVLDRMKHGGFRTQNLLDDALTIAIVESSVAMRAFDADRVEGAIGLRGTAPGEGLEGRPGALPAGTLVIADEARPIALLFGAIASGRGVRSRTRNTILVTIQVKGVPDIAAEEALWLACEVMGAQRAGMSGPGPCNPG